VQKKAGVQFTPELVTALSKNDDIYTDVTEKGILSKKLIHATSVEHYNHMPEI
jgi:hypothetical protein